MKRAYPKIAALLMLIGGIVCLVPGSAFAVGTVVGTVVTFGGDFNANATYNNPVDNDGECAATFVAGTAGLVLASNKTTKVVQQFYGGTIGSPPDRTNGQIGVATDFAYTLTNVGNGSDNFNLTVPVIDYGNGASAWLWAITDMSDNTISQTGALSEDAVASFKVRLTPTVGNAPDGAVATYTLNAASSGNSGATAYAGANGIAYGGLGGTFTDSAWLMISGPVISLTKTLLSINDPRGLGQAVPGAYLSYQTDITNTGSGAAAGVVIHDQIPDNTKLRWTGTLSDGISLPGGTIQVFMTTDNTWHPYADVASRADAESVTKVQYILPGNLAQNQGASAVINLVIE